MDAGEELRQPGQGAGRYDQIAGAAPSAPTSLIPSELIAPQTAVDRDHGSADVSRERRAEEHRHHSELLRFAVATRWDLRAREALALLGWIVAADLLTHDAAGRDRVDGDAEPAHVAG